MVCDTMVTLVVFDHDSNRNFVQSMPKIRLSKIFLALIGHEPARFNDDDLPGAREPQICAMNV